MILIRVKAIDVLMDKRGFKFRKELAAEMGVRPTHLSRGLRRGQGGHGPPTSFIDMLCAALRCQPGDFLEHVDSGHDLT